MNGKRNDNYSYNARIICETKRVPQGKTRGRRELLLRHLRPCLLYTSRCV
ncbi:hypothetical protein [Erwinia amylovora]